MPETKKRATRQSKAIRTEYVNMMSLLCKAECRTDLSAFQEELRRLDVPAHAPSAESLRSVLGKRSEVYGRMAGACEENRDSFARLYRYLEEAMRIASLAHEPEKPKGSAEGGRVGGTRSRKNADASESAKGKMNKKLKQ